MARRRVTSALPAPPELVRSASFRVLEGLDWEILDRGRVVLAREDAARLCCRDSPVQLEITIKQEGAGSRIEIAGEVAGWGPLATRSLESLEALRARISAEAQRSRSTIAPAHLVEQ